ncbi:uncharacterized protein SCHCODRAFT_02537852 [Schizophyllum commune H4-8]|uniref:uncharacterized protein n=1 Tax=Schizophyllum commune (strain H4-8 / FGSC 9210) TaxID=578458 RepID=UPI00215E5692|nr:uncharacterized protein SCHCODRAFT_02537852 [Schizophyllum commune H4-8]KAI5893177.1 hypothetical protein SCHCODRAFT_02537852 [Schizophyllum commune H4-8]
MALSPSYTDFLDALQQAVAKAPSLDDLPRNQQAAFRRQVKAQLALVKHVIQPPRRVIGGTRVKKTAATAAATTTTPQTSDELADVRLAGIDEAAKAEWRNMDDVWKIAIDPPEPMSRRETEDAAFVRLVRGIDRNTVQEWKQSAPHNTDQMIARQTYNDMDVHGDDGGLLVQLHNRICINETKHDVSFYRRRLIILVDTLEFGLRWQSIGLTRTGRSVEKDEFYKAVYKNEGGAAADFNKWKESVIKPIVNGRNRLVDIYRKFGLLVLLDPFWSVKSLANNSRTKEFPKICRAILENDGYDGRDDTATLAFFSSIGAERLVKRVIQLERELNEEDGEEEEEEEEEEEQEDDRQSLGWLQTPSSSLS